MPGSEWRDEARGIEPWGGARVRECGESGLRGAVGVVLRAPDGSLRVWWETVCPSMVTSITHGATLALDFEDTLAAFDRRLLERLGATREATTQGTGIYPVAGGEAWWFTAGGAGKARLFSRLLTLNVRDGLLARVRAWKIAAMEAAPR